MLGAVGVCPALGFDHKVYGFRGVEAPTGQRLVGGHGQHLLQNQPPAAGGRHGDDVHVLMPEGEGRTPRAVIIFKVFFRHHAALAFHFAHDQGGGAAGIKTLAPLLGHAAQHLRQVFLHKPIARCPCAFFRKCGDG